MPKLTSCDCRTDSAVLDKFSAGDSKINFDQLVSADAMDQLKDTLKEIEGSVDTALDQRRDAKTASDNKASELESSVTSLESAKSVVEVEVEELKSENAELKDTKRKLEDQLDSLKDKDSQMQTKIDQLEKTTAEPTAAPTAAPKKEDTKEDSKEDSKRNDDPQFTRFKGQSCRSCTDDQCSQCYDRCPQCYDERGQQECVMQTCQQVRSEGSQECTKANPKGC